MAQELLEYAPTMLAVVAKEKYVDPLKVRTMGEAYRQYAANQA